VAPVAGASQQLDVVRAITWSDDGAGTRVFIQLGSPVGPDRWQHDPMTWAPDREMLRLVGFENYTATELAVRSRELQRIRIGLHEGNTLHLVFDLADSKVKILDVKASGNRIELIFGRS
jgi:hypothetical protein